MYTVKIDDETLYIPGDKNFAITSPVLDLVLGGSGSFNFTIPKTNPRYDVVYNRKSMVSVFRDGKEIFYGEVRSQDKDFMGNKKVREMNQMDKPTMNYAVAYQRFRSTLNGTMINLQKEYPLPTYMIEGIVAGILADIRSAAIAESNSEEQSFAKENAEYYEKQLQELNDELLKLKAEKENSDDES